jgi:hypothetical protein
MRVLREGWAVPGAIRWRRGWMVSVRFRLLHPRATPLQERFSVLVRGRVRGVRDKPAAAGSGSGTLAVTLASAFTRCNGVTAALPVLPGGNRVPW